MERFEVPNLSILSEKELDFHNYAVDNVDKFLSLPIPDIAKQYGVGISFIYRFFEKMNFKNSKEFIFYLGYWSANKDLLNQDVINSKTENSMIYEIVSASNLRNAQLLSQQKNKIINLVQDLEKAKKVYCLGFGYSKLAIQDLFGFFQKWHSKFYMINDESPEELARINKIKDGDLVIIFSLRGIGKKFIHACDEILNAQPRLLRSYLITANPESPIWLKVDLGIEIDNVMKRVDYLNYDLIISPLVSLCFFNNYLKTIFYSAHRSEFSWGSKAAEEIYSWIDNNFAKKLF